MTMRKQKTTMWFTKRTPLFGELHKEPVIHSERQLLIQNEYSSTTKGEKTPMPKYQSVGTQSLPPSFRLETNLCLEIY